MTSPQTTSQATELADLLDRLEDSQKACFDAGQHVAAMDIQSARAALSSPVQSMDIWQAYAAAQDEIAALKRERAVIAIMARVESIGVHAKHDLKNTYIVSLKFERGDQPTIAQFEALRTAALAQAPATDAAGGES